MKTQFEMNTFTSSTQTKWNSSPSSRAAQHNPL